MDNSLLFGLFLLGTAALLAFAKAVVLWTMWGSYMSLKEYVRLILEGVMFIGSVAITVITLSIIAGSFLTMGIGE